MSDRILRDHLLELLRGGSAHIGFDEAIKGFPADLRGTKHQELPHTAWQLLEHLRITQWDILDFSRNPDYAHIKWPDDYWPQTAAPPDDAVWDQSVEQFRQDLKVMQDLVADTKNDLYAKISWGEGQTILREAMLIADHNAYHIGQIVSLRQALGAWQPAALP